MRALVLACLFGFATPAQGCDVALMLAVDVSGSVDHDEYRIQMDGLAAALQNRTISSALVDGQVELALMQWTGTGRQRVVINWTSMIDEAAVTAFAAQVAEEPRIWRNFSTAIGEAIALSLDFFEVVPECTRHVIDISGDGDNNEGRIPRAIWQDLETANVTVNALVIEESIPGLTAYFEDEVIFGPNAFAVTANSFEEYPQQIMRKLFRELTQAVALVD